MVTIDITNSELDSGNWVNMKAVTFVPGYKRNNEAASLSGLQTAAIPEGDRIGIEAPVFTIRGIINVDDFATTDELWSESPSTLTSEAEDGTSNAGVVTLGYLNKLWRENVGQTKIRLYLGDPSNPKQWKNWDNSSTEMYVVVDDFNPIPDQSSDSLHIVNYAIVCREVQVDGVYTN